MICPYNSLSSKKYLYSIYVINSQSDVRTLKSTNECVVIIKKYLYCIYIIMYSKKTNVGTVKITNEFVVVQ